MDSISREPDKSNRLFTVILVTHVVCGVIGLGLLGGAVYVVIHFLGKVW